MANRNSTTLRQVLTQQKPLLPCTSTSNRNTTHGSWPKLDESVVIWDEFNLKTLNESYGHLLDVAVPDTLLASPQANQVLAGIVVNTAEDINHLISWNHGLMEPTLRFAKSRLGLYPGLALYQKIFDSRQIAHGQLARCGRKTHRESPSRARRLPRGASGRRPWENKFKVESVY
ncbi:hypothetical protein MGU_11780 [Metarhizium guizhouense ARSEF 977]|uniref:Uncharacterized protein n=1 Tax=Metarhizium guizhouense (strain ARSEF 977) TaxID=1276136 RepID=A0A0B4G7X2_METGA|nr:hypothetical protein MGU_11780 [Metarhizium guizhouense ARSEF 977]